MSIRRLAPPDLQPPSFAFNAENGEWAKSVIAKYPQGRQASAVISLLWRGQEQEGWVTHPMIESVAKMLSMPFIRVLEVATFYTMFNLEPVGTHLVQVCATTPCWLQGSDAVVEACRNISIRISTPCRPTANFPGWKSNAWAPASTPRCCRSARISMKTLTGRSPKV